MHERDRFYGALSSEQRGVVFKGAKKWPKHFFFNVPSTAEEKRLPSIETEEGNIALMPARHPAGAQTGQPKSPPTPPREGFPSHFSFPCLLPSRPRQKAASPPQKKTCVLPQHRKGVGKGTPSRYHVAVLRLRPQTTRQLLLLAVQ